MRNDLRLGDDKHPLVSFKVKTGHKRVPGELTPLLSQPGHW